MLKNVDLKATLASWWFSSQGRFMSAVGPLQSQLEEEYSLALNYAFRRTVPHHKLTFLNCQSNLVLA